MATLPVAADMCILSNPDRGRLDEMKRECVTRWMARMGESSACTSYFAGVASSACSAADLRAACAETSARFTIQDAESLCGNLQRAHQAFWGPFWDKQQSAATTT
jgi:hypothetical protein